MFIPKPNSEICSSVVFLPGVYYSFYGENGIVVEDMKDIVIDGSSSVIVGGKNIIDINVDTKKDEFSYGYGEMQNKNLGYNGIGITLRNCENITLKNITAKGFEIGLLMENCEGCIIENNDFSYNYNNPDWGWDEHSDLGGIIVKNSNNNIIQNNKASNVWSALVLYNSNKNKVNSNDFSHTSNVGLRLWIGSYNHFENNNFSFGIRKKPDEIHARDSSSVLIESGSNHNVFIKNDMRYGGDGLFIRSLNNMVSEYNVFIENDTSFANNNAIEAWDANNVYIRNKANYSSYGFWLGNSDNTILIGNEIMYNGHIFKNAPESFGNAGLACVNGSGSNLIIDSNIISHNNGPGIALRFKNDHKIRNVLIKNNEISSNYTDSRGYIGYGVFLEKACNINFINNIIKDNAGEKIFQNKDTYNINIIENNGLNYTTEFIKIFSNENCYCINETYNFSISKEYENVLFIINEKEYVKGNSFDYSFRKNGKYNIEVVAYKGSEMHIGYKSLYVTENKMTVDGFLDIENWKTSGNISTIASREENKTTSLFNKDGILFTKFETNNLTMEVKVKDFYFNSKKQKLRLYLRYNNDFIDWDKEVRSPVIELIDNNTNKCEFIPKVCIQNNIYSDNTENRYDLHYIDLDENSFEIENNSSNQFEKISMVWETKIDSYFNILLCGIDIIDIEEENLGLNIAFFDENTKDLSEKYIDGTGCLENYNLYKIFSKQRFSGNKLDGYGTKKGMDTLNVRLENSSYVSSIKLNFYDNKSDFFLPTAIKINYNDKIIDINNIFEETVVNINEEIKTISIVFHKENNMLLYNLELYNNKVVEDIFYTATYDKKEFVSINNIKINLNIELNEDFENDSKLVYEVFESDKNILQSTKLLNGKIDVKNNGEIALPVKLTLVKDKEYHLMLSQEKLAESMSVGKYYRWVGSGLAKRDGTYFYINGNEVDNDTNKVGWGKCYLKLIGEDNVYNFSSPEESLGNRFGLNNMEKIFQKFKIENDFKYVFKPNFTSDNICSCNKDFKFTLKSSYDTIIYINLTKGCAVIKHNDNVLEIYDKKIKINLEKNKEIKLINVTSNDSILYLSK